MTRKNDKQNAPDLKALMVQNHDLMQPLMQWLLQEVLEGEMTDALGAAKGERCEARQGYRSGYYPRRLVTCVGTMELRVPQDRQGRFSTQLFERYQRSEKALVAALVEMYVQGVSTRKIKTITEELCGHPVQRLGHQRTQMRSSTANWSALRAGRWRWSFPTSSSMPATRRCARTA